ncbi:MAG: cytochrome c biosis protein CcmG, thiol:disulfide interchange protein DsbE [Myxococcales bacterium]|nr:cytochrome c biosis protein CcmG, thiol:disulfide interchange protein DsbE [Myxococcales bacterium]
MRITLHIFAAALLITSALSAGCGSAAMPASYAQNPLAPSGPLPAQSKPLPDIKRRTLEGATFDTAEARGKKVTVVKFFAKYCEPCKRSLPWFEQFAKQHPEVAMLGIAEDERESDVRDVATAFGLTFPIVHDTGNALSGRFRVTDMPITFVADKSGRIRWVGGPEQTEADLEAAVAASSSSSASSK